MQLLSTVEDSFDIEGRGCVVTMKWPNTDTVVKRHDQLRLVKPDGSRLDTRVEEFEFLKRGRLGQTDKIIAFSLPTDLTKIDVPQGTEVWLLNE